MATARSRQPSPSSPRPSRLRVLITGASGFAGAHLARACTEAGDSVTGVSRTGAVPAGGGSAQALDLLDAAAVRTVVGSVSPEVVYHLAALSSVGQSWSEPARTLRENVVSAANLLEALRLEAPEARVVWVSSCEVYGNAERLPIEEDAPLRPANPYAVSKAGAEMLAELYADAYELNVTRARPFSHAGPGQQPIFILSSLARQGAEARLAGARELRVATGNAQTRRDFTDVRDVVRAYRLLAGSDSRAVFNVSTGVSVSAAEHVQLLAELIAPIELEHVVDPDRVRAYEVMDLRGSHDRLTAATGWEPSIPLRQTFADTIEWWERELSRSGAVRH
jgi:GDP-4-dehydro-6-deoxy-D-mannose reductase